jgi:acid phosphatase type 7
VIAAAGDVACDPSDQNYNGGAGTRSFCRQRDTATLLNQGGYAAILPLGDEQYTDATLAKLNQVYDPTWGVTKPLHRPVPGNHEYLVDGAAGYYDYYGAQAGPRGKGYYSYDVGAWHVVALNGEAEGCPHVSCSSGSEQETWLRADLAAHPAQCTLAYWHVPKFSSTASANAPLFQTFWNDLYAAGVDVVLNGHFHNYERFAPQNASGAADPKGIREFVVGTGGKGLVGFEKNAMANSQVRNSNTYGVLQLTLHPGSYDWAFKPIAGQAFKDTGSTSCH